MGDLSGWAQALVAFISLVGMGMSWWYSNRSKNAKSMADDAARSAEDAQRRAEALLTEARRLSEATERQATAAEKAADEITKMNELQGPCLRIEWIQDDLYQLHNLGKKLFGCLGVLNEGEFEMEESPLKDGFQLKPEEFLSFYVFGDSEKPLPTNLVLRAVGSDEPIIVPIPPRN